MLANRQFTSLNESIKDLWNETNKRKAIDTGIHIANEVMKVFIPSNALWQKQLATGEEALDKVIPASKLPNQKAENWFVQHPYLGGERIVLEHFNREEAPFESRFYALNKASGKARVSASVHLTKNWEDSELTQNSKYKVGINFFLSGDSKRVLIVLSNQGNLRVMELSERLTHTQIEIFNKLFGVCELEFENITNDSAQKLIHTTLWDAFALHELNNKFYDGVALHFDLLLQHLTGNKSVSKNPEDAKLFASRLLGRLLFIWFLRKKNIVSESNHYFDTVKDLDGSAYYEKHLKQLFFETLNTPIKDRKSLDNETPYLNGGLFEYHKNDWKDEKISFPPDWFTTLYEHFDSFNFTTDESSPEYEQVAIDPEMLGRVFESLLATQITATGEQARKAKGAYYTPREIVAYMCKESLRQYLYTGLNNRTLNGGIDSLLDKHDAEFETAHTNAKRDLWGNENSEKVSLDVIALLDKIKILDPACGSGAFPLGMVQLLEKVYERLEPRFDRYKTKLQVIQNNIYGVDIEPMAVAISRLRAWLSIVVDEEDSRNIKPLPNLDFKFVCANSLVALEKQNDLFDDVTLIDKLLQIIQEYMHLHEPLAKDKKIHEYTDALKHLTQDVTDKPQLSKKTKQVLSWNPKQDTPSDFFDPAIMFAVKDGFDVVIGNPPYLGEKGHKDIFMHIKESWLKEFYQGKMDLFYFFFLLALNLLLNNGVNALITTNYYITALGARRLRVDFKKRASLIKLINFNELRIFPSALGQHNMITILQKITNDEVVCDCAMTSKNGTAASKILQDITSWQDKETKYSSIRQLDLFDGEECYIRFASTKETSILSEIFLKIKGNNNLLGDICIINNGVHTEADYLSKKKYPNRNNLSCQIGDGIYVLDTTNSNDKKVLKNEIKEKEYLVPFFKNSDIKKYATSSQSLLK